LGKPVKRGQLTLSTWQTITEEGKWQTQYGSFHIFVLPRRESAFSSQRKVTYRGMGDDDIDGKGRWMFWKGFLTLLIFYNRVGWLGGMMGDIFN
jgi:hypothetical protein